MMKIFAAAVLVLAAFNIAGAANQETDYASLVERFTEAHKSFEECFEKGRGSAMLRITSEEVGFEDLQERRSGGTFLTDFAFKGQMHRLDTFEVDENTGGKGDRIGSSINSVERQMRYYAQENSLRIVPGKYVRADNNFGENFRPDSLLRPNGKEIIGQIQYYLDNADIINHEIAADGKLKLYFEGSNSDASKKTMYAVFDPACDYLLTEFHRETKSGNCDWELFNHYVIEWDRGPGGLYPKHMVFEYDEKNIGCEGEIKPGSHGVAEIEIIEFDPEADVSDSDFTLQALNIPLGTIITDNITGTNYKHGSIAEAEDKLQSVVDDLRLEELTLEEASLRYTAPAPSAKTDLSEPATPSASHAPPSTNIRLYASAMMGACGLAVTLVSTWMMLRKRRSDP